MPDDRKVEQRRDEKGRFTGEFFFAPPELPPAQEQRDDAFMADFKGDPGEYYGTHPGAKPPPLPPPPPPPQEDDTAVSGIGESIGAAQTGAKAGGMLGGPVGAVAGGAAGFLLSQVVGSQRDTPIGSLEGSGGTMKDETGATLQAMLELQQRVARVGTPIKDAVTTQATGSKM